MAIGVLETEAQVVGQLFGEANKNIISEITSELKLIADDSPETAKLQALPSFSALKMNDYFFRFVKSVTILVEFTEFATKVVAF